ncbi:hypothetical protein ACFWBN_08835 [Streptomyces sp. NPDC059989]
MDSPLINFRDFDFDFDFAEGSHCYRWVDTKRFRLQADVPA